MLRLEMDSIREKLFANGTNSPDEREVSYAAMHLFAEYLLRHCPRRLLLVATYQPPKQRQAAIELAESLGISLLVIQFKVDPRDAVRRFWQRSEDHPAKDLTEARVRQLAANYKYYHRAPIIDTSRMTFDEVYRAAAEALDLTEGTEPGPLPTKLQAEWAALAQQGQK